MQRVWISIYIYIYALSLTPSWARFDPSFKRLMCLATLKSSDTTELSVDDNTYATPRGLSTLAKEFTAVTRIMQSFSNELITLVSGMV